MRLFFVYFYLSIFANKKIRNKLEKDFHLRQIARYTFKVDSNYQSHQS